MKQRLTMFFACLFLGIGMALAQSRLTGVVTSAEDGEPVVAASVKAKGLNVGTVTNVDGEFTINVPVGTELEITYLGMIPKRVKASNNMRIVLESDRQSLDGVVVMGYGSARKLGTIAGSVETVTSDKLANRPVANVGDALQGQVAGLQVFTSSGEPSATTSMRIRGVTSLYATTEPLFILDGSEVSQNTFLSLNPNDIENMTVQAARMAYISNLMGYPTDCPQREKNGWTGDGHLAIETAFYNYDAITVYEKWLADHRDEQQPNGVLPDIIPTDGWGYGTDNGLDWTSTIAIIPWNIYLFYGDMRPLAECYDNMKRYVDYVDSNSPEHLSAWGRGDWVPVKTQSDKLLTSSIYFFADATILSKAAALLGHDDDHRRYAKLAADIRDAINARFLNRETAVYAGGSQTEMSLALMWKVVPDDMTRRVAARLAEKVRANDWHLDVGVHGAKAILNALSENGYAEDAYRIAVQDTYPSWGWWIVNGATTLLENWDLKATRDISDNHIMFGEIGAWPYKGLGGIFPDERQPGFRHINLRPNFVRDLRHFEASHNSPYGTIVSKWNRKGKTVAYTVTLPSNTTATLTISGAGDGGKTVELEAGTHSFEIKDNGRYKRVSR